jgi:cyclic-di-GMP phosphodiesterase TipF (flagellum assembly factor)
MEQNTELASRLFFEFSQEALDHCGPVEQESLDALAALGFRFSLDQVSNLDIDFQDLHARGFRTLKLDAALFLNGMGQAGARIHPADMKSYLERFGMQLVIERLEDEATLASVLDHHVQFGQGHLFSEPRPVRPEVFGEKADDAAAA